MAESQNFLGTEESKKEALIALMQKDSELTDAIEKTFARVQKYEEREMMLKINNDKLQTQLKNLREGNQHLISGIAENNSVCEQLRQEIKACEVKNEAERKVARDKLDAKIAYYGNAMCGAYREYRTDNLEAEQRVYAIKSAAAREEIEKYQQEFVELEKKFEEACACKEIDEVDKIIEMLKKEDEELVRNMRSKENECANLNKQIKQLKLEVAELKKK